MKFHVSILLLSALAALAGCAAPGAKPAPAGPRPEATVVGVRGDRVEAEPIAPEWLRPPADEFVLGPGDVVETEIVGVRGTKSVAPLLPDGTYLFDLLPAVPAAGLSLPQLRQRLEDELRPYYRQPQVALILRRVQSKRVWVMGRVSTPGIYPLESPMTVIEAIARAGGLMSSRFSGTTEELADLRHSFVLREGRIVPVNFQRLLAEGDASQNIYLRDKDYVFLPSALSKEVYVLGAVYQPRAVAFRDRVTLVSALANARDVLPGAHLSRVLIIRGSLSVPEVFTADYEAIRRGRAPDIALEPRDIVWVPQEPWHDLKRYVGVVLQTFARTVAANEGAHYAVPGAATPSVTLPMPASR